MTDRDDASATTAGAWGQAVAAVAVVGALGAGLWALGETENTSSERAPQAAACSEEEPEERQAEDARRLSGAQLCAVLNRPDLAALLGTPGELAQSAGGGDGSFGTGSNEIATPSARVEFDTYTVTLTATYDDLPVDGYATLLGPDAHRRTVLERPAVLYSQRTISIGFRLDGSDAQADSGVPARVVSVAQDARDRGGSFELAVWRSDGVVPEDAVLLRVAERVLPTIPGWDAAG
ncbi:DUF6215 domain-containing protein [Streptomyces poriticola]|uniref:DUF6215 domain-containing protein n=1 Tax=Streptomyces poriticola TaxID=3120506 RepID=UPI002FCE1CCB